tara:strand:- start:2194 stop:2340 length:147 start_codon:yes stop_codon:yes gene_type:complete
MLSKNVMGGGAILVAVLMALTVAMGWSSSLHYLWAAVVAIWGILWLKG